MDIKELKKMINLMKNSDVSEIEVESGGERVRIVRNKETSELSDIKSMFQSVAHFPAVSLPQGANAGAGGAALTEQEADAANVVAEGHVQLTSPMVGTFYSSPSPDSPVYVRTGDIVKKGDVLCIIEAMKLMNEIESEVDGKIVSILAKNAQPVEYGQALFIIDPQ